MIGLQVFLDQSNRFIVYTLHRILSLRLQLQSLKGKIREIHLYQLNNRVAVLGFRSNIGWWGHIPPPPPWYLRRQYTTKVVLHMFLYQIIEPDSTRSSIRTQRFTYSSLLDRIANLIAKFGVCPVFKN